MLPGNANGVRGSLDIEVKCGVMRSVMAEREEKGGMVIDPS